ncbi:DciA family protein [Streptomyces sp. enrichment culture]|uniref:DciA family protein n=1 Tax=Streptomyces sp. enrichment culture TaxID=1795815 RepID=UPI003F574906
MEAGRGHVAGLHRRFGRGRRRSGDRLAGSILDQWPDIAASLSPKLAAHVQAVAFHADTGQLDLRPDSPAYATQLRLITSRIVTAANDAVGTQAVRTVRVLAGGRHCPGAPAGGRDVPGPVGHQALEHGGEPGRLPAVTPHRRPGPALRLRARSRTAGDTARLTQDSVHSVDLIRSLRHAPCPGSSQARPLLYVAVAA